MSRLFEPLSIGNLTLDNRIVIAPMCQYSAENGSATDWHMIHLGSLALSGAGLLSTEATAVSPEGRISPEDLGLYSDANEAAMARVLEAIRAYSPIRSSRSSRTQAARARAGRLGTAARKSARRSRTVGTERLRRCLIPRARSHRTS